MFTKQKKFNLDNLTFLTSPKEDKESKSFSNQSAVLILGDSRAGKSTFVNYMAGLQMEISVAEDGSETVYPKLGLKEFSKSSTPSQFEGQTREPVAVPSEKNFFYLDCGGFNYISTYNGHLNTTILTLTAIKKCRSISGIVACINYDELSDKANDFDQVFERIEKFIPLFRASAESILFLITRPSEKLTNQHILNKLKQISKREKSQLKSNKSATTLLEMLDEKPNNLMIFRPTDESQRSIILEKIQTLSSIPTDEFVFPALNPYHALFEKTIFETVTHFSTLTYRLSQLGSGETPKIINEKDDIQHKLNKMSTYLKNIYNITSRIKFKSDIINQFPQHYEKMDLSKKNMQSLRPGISL